MEGAVIALLCRTSDRDARGSQGARALATELAARLGRQARIVGSPGEPRAGTWDEDLRASHGCLLEAGGQLEDALAAGRYPVLTASDCSICLTTLPTLARHRPDAWVLWLDAHGDFNSPETTPSGFLGGMCLAAACGVWQSGLGDGLDPARVVMCGVRDVDPGERVLLETRGVGLVERPGDLADHLRGLPVYVHLDLDVLDPTVMPATFPAPGGLSDGGLRTLLAEVAEAADLIGVEITAFSAPERAKRVATIVEPLLPVAA
ncbi:MAG TPA: arginase family protein [Solirubrobacteraceae bacterium]|nr:arginase family protein [Solirubrobacteraceae bacterium]